MSYRTLAVVAIAAAAAVTGVFVAGKRQGELSASSAGSYRPGGQVPGNHSLRTVAAEGMQTGGGVAAATQTRFTHFRVGNKNVKSIYADGKIVWIGTSGGVVRYDTTNDSYKLFDNRNGLLSNGVFFVGRIKGRLMVGTYGGGLAVLDETNNTWKTYNIPDGLGDAFVYDVIETRSGDIWIATWSGANRVIGGALDERKKWELYTVENTKGGLPNDWVYGLADGKNGDEVWLATEGGMARFAEGKWENWNHARGIGAPYEKVKSAIEFKNDPGKASVHHAKQKQEMGLGNVDIAFNPNYIVALEVANDGKVWAGTWGGGLAIYDGKTWTNYSTVEGLPGNHVFMLHQDRQGRMWIGTNRGMAEWDDGKFRRLTTADGLFDDNVFSMATTEDGGMWVGSFGGVAFLKPETAR